METFRKHWLLVLLLVAWFPSVITLWPLPSETVALQAGSVFLKLAQDKEKAKDLFSEKERQQLDHDVELLTHTESLLSLFWQRWFVVLLVTVLGAAAVVNAARKGKYWGMGILVSSFLYLGFVNGFPISRAVRTEQWTLWWQMLTQYPDWGISAVIYGVALPLLHVFLIVGMTISVLLATLKQSNLTSRLRPTR
jgi:hypothetical protein